MLFLRVVFEAGVLATVGTHSQELEGFEALARDHCHLLHFTEEADFIGREPGREREGHGWVVVCTMALLVRVLVDIFVPLIVPYTVEWRSRVGRACPAIKVEIDRLKRSEFKLVTSDHLDVTLPNIPFFALTLQ